MRDTSAVRAGEELPLDRLGQWIGEPVEVEQFAGGHSNLTYLVRTPTREYVLRRAPLGPVPPKAHDMAREFRVLQQIHPLFPEAPEVYRLCEDTTVIGAVFYLMERREGIIVRAPQVSPVEASRMSEALVECLARLHSVYAEIGKPEGFLDRQVSGWADRWRKAETPDQPDLEDVISWLHRTMPISGPPSIVHNDFKLDNIMFDEPLTTVRAVLDWEMATAGDPLADVGLSLCYWTMGSVYARPEGSGWYSRDELLHRYSLLSGRDISNIHWYETLGVFKLAVIIQQIYVRWVRGQTRDERFRDFGSRVQELAGRAKQLAGIQ